MTKTKSMNNSKTHKKEDTKAYHKLSVKVFKSRFSLFVENFFGFFAKRKSFFFFANKRKPQNFTFKHINTPDDEMLSFFICIRLELVCISFLVIIARTSLSTFWTLCCCRRYLCRLFRWRLEGRRRASLLRNVFRSFTENLNEICRMLASQLPSSRLWSMISF